MARIKSPEEDEKAEDGDGSFLSESRERERCIVHHLRMVQEFLFVESTDNLSEVRQIFPSSFTVLFCCNYALQVLLVKFCSYLNSLIYCTNSQIYRQEFSEWLLLCTTTHSFFFLQRTSLSPSHERARSPRERRSPLPEAKKLKKDEVRFIEL